MRKRDWFWKIQMAFKPGGTGFRGGWNGSGEPLQKNGKERYFVTNVI